MEPDVPIPDERYEAKHPVVGNIIDHDFVIDAP
jgi:hypothetical protein